MSHQFIELIHEENARSFLKKALRMHLGQKEKMNISKFSKTAGFSSRSFISEYLSGKKNLSQDSLNKIRKSLSLPKEYLLFFSYLVFKEQHDLITDRNINLEQEIQKIKTKIIQLSQGSQRNAGAKSIIGKRQALRVYTSLNSKETGSSLLEIVHKTKLDISTVQWCLDVLVQSEMVRYKNQKFYALDEKLDFFNFTDPELTVLTKDITTEINKQAAELIQKKDSLIFYSAISVNKNDLSEIKDQLRTAIYGVLDKFQVENGDQVEQLFVCLKN